MRHVVAVASLALFVFSPQTATAQIIVGDANERKINTTPEYGWCWMQVGDVWYVSGVVFLPDNEFSSRFVPAFKSYLESNYGRAKNQFCGEGDDYTIDSSIKANPLSKYIKTGWTGSFPLRGSDRSLPTVKRAEPVNEVQSKSPPVKGSPAYEVKYQRELEAYNARLAEIERIKADIRKTKADNASRHAANTLAAQQRLAQHEGDMARHRQQVAQVEAARRQYETDLAALQQRVRDTETRKDREAKIDWKEGVVVCELNSTNPQARFGNWRCEGPLQMTYAKLGNPGQAVSAEAIVPLSQACGGAREAVRDLGMVGDLRVFGCSYGIHPQSKGLAFDAAAKHGLSYIPGRITYRCPAYKSGCRTK